MKCPYCKRGGGNIGEPCKGCGFIPDLEDRFDHPMPPYNPLMQGFGSASCSGFVPDRDLWYGSGSQLGPHL